jgi:hypothetical protein
LDKSTCCGADLERVWRPFGHIRTILAATLLLTGTIGMCDQRNSSQLPDRAKQIESDDAIFADDTGFAKPM